ncbi:SDR family NAD(P)-dependent oxidoreductase [Ruegeria sp.]|uniref:SDR family NAD(P)-dependent oxidoreductase n=1 Tax=Ruegeria sp. TaxID=1879320 RepID=UPI003B5A5188
MKRPTGNLWLETFFARKTTEMVPNRDLTGKTIIFTGGTDGMGRVAVERFAEMGADICLFGRNLEKTQRVVDELIAAGHKGQFSVVQCDLGLLDQVRRAAAEVLERFERIDYLINCAGINMSERKLTPDGFEVNFAVNYLGPYLLTELLLERIKATPGGRIIQLVSGTQQVAKLNFEDLQLENKWSLLASYAQAKLCLIMHGRDVAKRLVDSDTTINCLNPGYIKSNLGRDSKGLSRVFGALFGKLAAPTWVGGERIVAAALDEKYQQASGEFIYEDILLAPNPLALDDANVARMKEITLQMTGLAPAQAAE